MEKATKNEMKQEAIRRLKALKIYEQVINEFDKEDVKYYSENGGILYWVSNEEEFVNMVKKEEEKGNLVYHAILNHTEFGNMFSMLIVSPYKSEWEFELVNRGDKYGFNAFASVVNGDMCDMGNICVKEQWGGLVRTY